MFPAGRLPAKFSRAPEAPEAPSRPDPACPECGGTLHIEANCLIVLQDRDERELSRREAPVAFCSGCEFTHEIEWHTV